VVGTTVWFTGLSGSGKSTIAACAARMLEARGRPAYLLDGDDLREGLNSDLGFSSGDRMENIRRVGEVALLFAASGHLTLVTVISPYAASRSAVRKRHRDAGVPFVEVHVATPLEICEQRDPKGLYARARSGELARFTGVTDPYEEPNVPEVRLGNVTLSAEEEAASVIGVLLEWGLA